MSKESYARGFVKAACERGVDPVRLSKFAQSLTHSLSHSMIADRPNVSTNGVGNSAYGRSVFSGVRTPEEYIREVNMRKYKKFLDNYRNSGNGNTIPRKDGLGEMQTLPGGGSKWLKKHNGRTPLKWLGDKML